MDSKIALVLGATGKQGGAVGRELLSRGWSVRALTRAPRKEAAQRLRASGAVVIEGDMGDVASLDAAMAGADAVFSVQALGDPVAEERYGTAVASCALKAGVGHVVYSSVGGAERGSGIPHFESKGRIEARLRNSGVPFTILRPTFFMDNFLYGGPKMEAGRLVLRLALQEHSKLQMIATADIGVLAAEAFDHPDHYVGTSIEIAGDELTGCEIAEVFERVGRRPVEFAELPTSALRSVNSGLADMFAWINSDGYRADIGEVRRRHPGLRSFEAWLTAMEWRAPTV